MVVVAGLRWVNGKANFHNTFHNGPHFTNVIIKNA